MMNFLPVCINRAYVLQHFSQGYWILVRDKSRISQGFLCWNLCGHPVYRNLLKWIFFLPERKSIWFLDLWSQLFQNISKNKFLQCWPHRICTFNDLLTVHPKTIEMSVIPDFLSFEILLKSPKKWVYFYPLFQYSS